MTSVPTGLLLRGGRSAEGNPFDVAVETVGGTITATGSALSPDALFPGDTTTVIDCRGMVLLAAPVEPHAHLDKALSGLAAPNPSGRLESAIAAWHRYWPN